jgi:hypothetical protein
VERKNKKPNISAYDGRFIGRNLKRIKMTCMMEALTPQRPKINDLISSDAPA